MKKETETEKGEERKDKGKKKENEKMKVDSLGGKVIKIRDSDIEEVEKSSNDV